MNEGKPKDQALAVAYSVRKRAKKMAKGGPVSAKTEARPMPEQKSADSVEVSQNSMKKPLVQADMTSHPEMKQARKGLRTTPIKHPRMAHSDVLQARLQDEEDHLQAMAKGGMINEEVSMKDSEEDMVQHPEGLESDNDEMSPPEEEIMAKKMASGGSTDRPDTGWGKIIFKADGGEISPEDEVENDEESSIAAAIMARKKMAEGGVVDNNEEESADPSPYDDRNEAVMKENYDQDMEDVSQPMDSNEHGHILSDEDEHDGSLVSKIMAKRRKSAMVK